MGSTPTVATKRMLVEVLVFLSKTPACSIHDWWVTPPKLVVGFVPSAPFVAFMYGCYGVISVTGHTPSILSVSKLLY